MTAASGTLAAIIRMTPVSVTSERSTARSGRSRLLPGGGPGLTRFSGAGFPLHQDAPGGAGSYRPSTGVSPLRSSGGEVNQPASRVGGHASNSARTAWLSPLSMRTIACYVALSSATLLSGVQGWR